MDTSKLKKFAQQARRLLMEQVAAKLALVTASDSLARRERAAAVQKLEEQIAARGEAQVIEQVAYTWFNRFCALRYMDVKRYSRIGVLSPLEEQFQPEILAEAKGGYVDEDVVKGPVREQIFALLDGSAPSVDGQAEAYRLLIVAVCNGYHRIMPYLFERIDDYTELLMPDDLLSGSSIVAVVREAMTPDACEGVEVIGWLYQFYISEKKDDVFAALKKGKKITPENIPAATQLFTPHWIVRCLVENSLGRLWMLNHPDSRLIEQMDYYIRPEEPETDFLQISSPEEIKICDPACGSGHMLTYAFDLLYAIYEEQGYQASDIPRLILTHNLYGIEIDQRAGALAAFALTMKAREKYRRFLTGGKVVQPNICVLENIKVDPGELDDYMDKVGRDLFSGGLQGVVNQWEEADNFGSLIRPLVTDVSEVLELLRERQMGEDLFLQNTHQKVLKALRLADYLSPKYHVAVANPPYMGSRSMSAKLSTWLKKHYRDAKADLFAACIERCRELCQSDGKIAMVTMQSWMFISAFEELRKTLLDETCIDTLVQIGFNSFPELNSKVALACAFVLTKQAPELRGTFVDVNDQPHSADKGKALLQKIHERDYFIRDQQTFKAIAGSPVAYWASEALLATFKEDTLSTRIITEGQNKTADNDKYLRCIWEVDHRTVGPEKKWLKYAKGGGFRKWYGNIEYVVDWSPEARSHYRESDSCRIVDERFWNKSGITWTDISITPGFRFLPPEGTFDMSGPTAFFECEGDILKYLSLLNSSYTRMLLPLLNPTLHAQLRDIRSIPLMVQATECETWKPVSTRCIEIAKTDWQRREASGEFTAPAISWEELTSTEESYSQFRDNSRAMVAEMIELEEKNNRSFAEPYGLSSELSPNVPLREISLDCNPSYRYDEDKSESELEALLLADTMREFISYAVGCMLGRYSLDKPGLILANQGETADDYRQQIPEPTFAPDEDNVIPLLDGDWFTDDIAERFKAFLKVTFGTEHYEENLTFLENALYPDNLTGKKRKTIRDYFLKEFYNHHIKLYKKRPIYWLFSSPKGTFNALIYMHRYRPDTVSIILNDYLREFQTKLTARQSYLEALSISESSPPSEKTKALREIEKLKKDITELKDYERQTLYPLATQQIEIALDDGVKVNYPKFGKALKKVPGLS